MGLVVGSEVGALVMVGAGVAVVGKSVVGEADGSGVPNVAAKFFVVTPPIMTVSGSVPPGTTTSPSVTATPILCVPEFRRSSYKPEESLLTNKSVSGSN